MRSNGVNNPSKLIGQAKNPANAIPATEGRASVSDGERSSAERAMALPSVARARTTDPEVRVQAVRRRFSAQYKLKILAELDNCKNSGEVGALLRREGLYSSHLTKWRRQQQEGALSRLEPQKRGRKQGEVNPLTREVARLQKENQQLHARLKQAETIIEVQKKVSQLLGITLSENAEQS